MYSFGKKGLEAQEKGLFNSFFKPFNYDFFLNEHVTHKEISVDFFETEFFENFDNIHGF